MKILAAALLGVQIAALMIPAPIADAIAVISVRPVTNTVRVGDPFAEDIEIANVADLFAFQFNLSFAPGVLSGAGITEGSFLLSGGFTFFIPGTIDNVGGTVSDSADSLVGSISGVNGGGTLAEMRFNAVGLGTSSVILSNVLLLDSNLSSIPFSIATGSVNVQSRPVPEPSSLILVGLASFLLAIGRRQFFSRSH